MVRWSRVRRISRSPLAVAGGLVIVLTFLLARHLPEQREAEMGRFTVTEIVDGDTFHTSGGDKVRLANVDTPEKDEPYYEEAADLLESLVLFRPVKLEYPPRRRDQYGRLLAYISIDSTFIGEELLRAGLGYVLLFNEKERDHPRVKRLIAAQQKAIDDRVGLWSLERVPESHYLVKKARFRLHRPFCRSVEDLDSSQVVSYATREEGLQQGYAPCRRCRP